MKLALLMALAVLLINAQDDKSRNKNDDITMEGGSLKFEFPTCKGLDSQCK